MKSNNYLCYQYAASLDRNEWNRFVREVLEGRLTRHTGTQALLKVLSPLYPDFDLADEQILEHRHFVKGQNLAQLRVLRNNLKQLLQRFLLDLAVERDKRLQDRLLIDELIHRGQIPLAESALKKALRNLPEQAMNLQDLKQLRELEAAKLDLYTRQHKRNQSFDWPHLLDQSALYEHVRNLLFLSAWKGQVWFLPGKNPELGKKIEQALTAIEQFGPDRSPLLLIYYHLLALLSHRDPDVHDTALQRAIHRYGANLDRIDLINLLGLQVNFLIESDIRGVPGSLRRAFEVYRYMVEQHLLFGLGSFSTNSTRNILSFGVRLRELDWTESFLDLAKQKLPEEEAGKFFPYGKAYLAFAKLDFAQVRLSLREANFQDPFYSLAQRVLLLRTHFMERDAEAFFTEHATLTRQLYRNRQLSASFTQSLLNFLKAIRQVYEAREAVALPSEVWESLLLLTHQKRMPHRDWLRKQIRAERDKRRF